jgi:hypothetical protein
MNIHDFSRSALSLEGAEESSHMGSPDFPWEAGFSPLRRGKARLWQHHDHPRTASRFRRRIARSLHPRKRQLGSERRNTRAPRPRQRRFASRRITYRVEAPPGKKHQSRQKRPSAVKTSAREEPVTQKALVPFDRYAVAAAEALHPACPHLQAMSGVFSIASHSMLQYFPDVTAQEQTGCAHFLPSLAAIMSPFKGCPRRP